MDVPLAQGVTAVPAWLQQVRHRKFEIEEAQALSEGHIQIEKKAKQHASNRG